MPTLDQHEDAQVVRGLLVGDSGSGKSGALASLVEDGYRLFIADYDNGIDILANILKAKNKALLKQVDYQSIRPTYKIQGDKAVPQNAEAWKEGLTYLQSAVNKGLGPDDVLVLDSLSFGAKFAMQHILKINGRLTAHPWESDYGEAQKLVEDLVSMLTDPDAIQCNVLCTAHIAWTVPKDDPNAVVRGLPAIIGKALNPVIPRYFNHLLACRSVGDGPAKKRYIHTQPMEGLELKNSNPAVVKDRYPLETGLRDYFQDILGVPGPARRKSAAA